MENYVHGRPIVRLNQIQSVLGLILGKNHNSLKNSMLIVMQNHAIANRQPNEDVFFN
jgi:hypothetical protein